jgi:hypothetical protein
VIALPSFRGVPYVSRIEYYCRLAGEEPKSNEDGRKNRKRRVRRIARLLCRDDVSDADWSVVADYLMGKFDRKPGQGRPVNYERERVRQLWAGRVEAIRRELRCSRDAALRAFLTENGVDDPDAELFSYLRSYINR